MLDKLIHGFWRIFKQVDLNFEPLRTLIQSVLNDVWDEVFKDADAVLGLWSEHFLNLERV